MKKGDIVYGVITNIIGYGAFVTVNDYTGLIHISEFSDNYVRNIGDVNKSAAIKKAKEEYPNIFTPFRNENPLTKFFSEYRCEFVPFQTGTYTKTQDGGVTYQEGPKEYCAKLWNVLLKKIRG